MTIKFNPNSLNSVFDKNFGAGAYNSGLSNAQKAARLKTQANFAKQSYLKYLSDAQSAASKKTYQDAISYWSDPTNKNSLKKQGAYKAAEEIKNDPNKQAEIENQGYSVSDYIDAMYNAASDGKFRSEREYNSYASQLAKDTAVANKKADKESKAKYGMTVQERYDLQQQQKKAQQKKQKDLEKNGSLWNDIKTPAVNAWHAINPFDDVSFEEAVKKNIKDATSTNRSKVTKETTRGLTRAANTGTLGLLKESYKATNNGIDAPQFSKRKGAGKAADFAYDALGYGLSGGVIDAGVSKLLGANLVKSVGGKALRGGLSGLGLTGGEVGIKEALNPNDQNWKQNAAYMGVGAGIGAVADPVLSAIGTKIAKVLGKGSKSVETENEEATLLGLPEPQKALTAPQAKVEPLQLPEPKQTQSSLDTLLNVGKKPNGLQNPIPGMPNKLKNIMMQNDLKNAMVDFGQNAKNMPKARPQYITSIERPVDPLNRGQQYWQSRYEDFTKFVKDNGYDENNLNRDSIQELWSQFAKYDEPVNLEQVVDLAYPKGFEAPKAEIPKVETPKEPTMKDYLDSDPRIKQMIQTLFPPVKEQKISRPATLEEMVQRLETLSKAQPESIIPPITKQANTGTGLGNVLNDPNFLQFFSKETQKVLNELTPVVQKMLQKNPKANVEQMFIQAAKENGIDLQALIEKDLAQSGKNIKGILPGKSNVGSGYETIKSTPTNETLNTSSVGKLNPVVSESIQPKKQPKLVDLYQEKNDQLKEEVAKMLTNSDNWKDKGRFALGRETMDRNFEDIMGKDAETFKKKFLDPIKSEEANRVRFLNTEREQVRSYGMKAKSLDDQLVQMYGEKKITLSELKQKTPNWKKVVKVTESYRAKYDQLLNTVNKVLQDNGFDPIPKRSDYFPHYEEVDGIMKQFGFDMENNSLPTDINGLTDVFKPNKQFFRNALQRKGDETTFGAIEGFDRYIEGISNVIYHTKNIKQLRALDKVIRTKYAGDTQLSNFAAELTEYTNLLAGKKAKVDRAIEDRFGRKVYNVVETLRRRTGANIVGANLSSALTNFIPLTQSLATTEKKAFVKGLAETLANVVKNDGFINESDFLTKRIGSDPLYRTMWDKAVDKSFYLMRTLDNFTSQVVVRGKFNELLNKGVPRQEAIKQADQWASKLIADRSKGGMPTLFNSKTFGILSQFQLEVNNQVSFLTKDIPRNAKSKAALASAIGQVLIYSYLFNNLYEKAVGRRPAFDPIGIAFQATKDYNNTNLTKGVATKNLGMNIANQLPFTSMFTGGRFPISSGMPDVGGILTGTADLKEEAIKPLLYLGLPSGGGQLRKTVQGLTTMNHNPLSPQGTTGVYQGDKLKFPVENNVPNNIRGALFGQYSFPESKEYYDNSRTALSPKQTLMVEQNPEAYQSILVQQFQKKVQNKITDIQKDQSLSEDEKMKKIMSLMQQLQGR